MWTSRSRAVLFLTAVALIELNTPVLAQNRTVTVTVATPVARKVTQWDEYTGRFEASERVAVRPRVSGYIDKVHFADGADVKQGDLLFTIDRRPFEIAVDAARADLARAHAQVTLGQVDYQRAQELVRSATTSVRDLDQRKANLDTAQAQVMS